MSTAVVTPLRQRMIEDMNARKLCAGTQRGHIHSCERFAAFLKRSPDTATTEDIRRFQLHLAEAGASICNRNRIMTGLRFLFRVTLRRLDLAAEVYHIREPQNVAPVKGDPPPGQSFLSKLLAWTIDNQRHALVLNDTAGPVGADGAVQNSIRFDVNSGAKDDLTNT
jgi:hypothetical protein